MRKRNWGLAALALAGVAGCGDGGSPNVSGGAGTIAAAPTPTPTPSASATPSPVASAGTPSALSPSVGLHQQASFPTLSWYLPENTLTGIANGTDLARVGYDSAAASTTLAVPGFAAGYLNAYDADASFVTSALLPGDALGAVTLRPGPDNLVLALNSASVGDWYPRTRVSGGPTPTYGVFAYGIPTPAGDLPTTGGAHFTLYGRAIFDQASEGITPGSFGAELDVDFAARTVAGKLVATNNIAGASSPLLASAQTLGLSLTRIASDGSFAGTLNVPSGTTRYEGWFAGPQGREVIIRWFAPYSYNGSYTPTLYGVLAGKR